MRVGTTHRRALIFENLDPCKGITVLRDLGRPKAGDLHNFIERESWERFAMVR